MSFAIDFVTNVLGNSTITLGIITYTGLMFLRKNVGDIVMGTIRVAMGYLILNAGTTTTGTPIILPTTLMQRGLDVDSVLPLYWVVYAESIAKFGTEAALIFITEFVIDTPLAKFTPWENLAMTVHLQLFWAGFMTSTMAGFGFSGIILMVVGGPTSGAYYWIATITSAHYLKSVTTEHTGSVPNVITLVIVGEARGLSKKDGKSTEEVEFPNSLNQLKDSIVATCITVLVMNFIFTFIVGPAVIRELAEGTSWIPYVLIQSLTLGGGITVVPHGVHMMLAELIPAPSGVTEKLLPNAVLSLDYSTVFPYTGTVVMFGSVFGLLSSILATLVMAFTGFSPVVIPGAQIDFFGRTLAGVYVNARGGLRNCIFSALIAGPIPRSTMTLTFPMIGCLVATGGAYEAMDFNTIRYLIAELMSLFH